MKRPDNSRRADVENPLVDGWDRAELSQSTEWRNTIDDRSVEEVRAHLVRHGAVLPTIHAAEFPALGALADRVRHQLARRYGIVWLRRDPLGSSTYLTDREHGALFSILASLMGLAHREIPRAEADRSAGATAPSELATLVVDGLVPDVLGVLRLTRSGEPSTARPSGQAARGADAEVTVVSGKAVHRELESQHAEMARLLYAPTLQDGGETPTRLPIFRYERRSRSLEFRYSRSRIMAAHADLDQPIGRSLRHALDALDKSLNLPHLVASVRLDRGDIMFVNNKLVATAGMIRPVRDGVEQYVRIMRQVNPLSSQAESAVG